LGPLTVSGSFMHKFLITRQLAANQVEFLKIQQYLVEKMNQDIVFKEIAGYLKCDPGTITPATRLDVLGIDSLGAITILYDLEDKLDIEVPNEVFDSLDTVGDILTQIELIIAQKTQT